MKIRALLAPLALTFAVPAAAQSVESAEIATNGVQVTVHSDEFAGRYEYTSPAITFGDRNSFALVASVVENGEASAVRIIGSVFYRGDWRIYNTAILRGGEEVESLFNDRDVVSCRGSRYSGCSYMEGFRLFPSAAQIEQYAVDGTLSIQLRAQSGGAVVVEVPVSYIDAIREVAVPR